MAKAVAAAVPSDKLALYEKLVATNPSVERKGAMVPYTSLNGHMFSYLTKEGKLALRLPPGELEAFLKKYKTSVMRGIRNRPACEYAHGSRLLAARLHPGVEEVLRLQLRICGLAQTQAHHEKKKKSFRRSCDNLFLLAIPAFPAFCPIGRAQRCRRAFPWATLHMMVADPAVHKKLWVDVLGVQRSSPTPELWNFSSSPA